MWGLYRCDDWYHLDYDALCDLGAFVCCLRVILQQFEGNLIYPYVVGGSTGLPGIWVIFAITIGSALGGILGMLVSVPVAATLYQIVKDNVVRREEAKAANTIENND